MKNLGHEQTCRTDSRHVPADCIFVQETVHGFAPAGSLNRDA